MAFLEPIDKVKNLSTRIASEFRGYYQKIFYLHILFLVIAIVSGLLIAGPQVPPPKDPATGTPINRTWSDWREANQQWVSDFILGSIGIFATVQILTNMLILWSSLKSEATSRQTNEFTSFTTRASTYTFPTFESHLLWINENLSPEQYPGKNIHLYTSVSTPIYGLATGSEQVNSCELYLGYLEAWVAHFERFQPDTADAPIWELCFWKKEDNIEIFCNTGSVDIDNSDQLNAIRKFVDICKRIYALENDGRINLNLYFSERSDTRWFFLKSGERYSGICCIFSPLSTTALQAGKWILAGISFHDQESYKNLSKFNYRLQHADHNCGREDKKSLLREPEKWIADHYGFELSKLSTTPTTPTTPTTHTTHTTPATPATNHGAVAEDKQNPTA